MVKKKRKDYRLKIPEKEVFFPNELFNQELLEDIFPVGLCGARDKRDEGIFCGNSQPCYGDA